jgi:hypothetical protein
VPYLEKICKVNLNKLSDISATMRRLSRKEGLKESWTGYNKWGKGGGIRLIFSVSRKEFIEKAYATHHVDVKRMSQLAAERAERKEKKNAEPMEGMNTDADNE